MKLCHSEGDNFKQSTPAAEILDVSSMRNNAIDVIQPNKDVTCMLIEPNSVSTSTQCGNHVTFNQSRFI